MGVIVACYKPSIAAKTSGGQAVADGYCGLVSKPVYDG